MGPGSGLVTRAACWPHPFPLPTGHTGRLLRALLIFSLLFLAAHLTFQICLHTVPGLDQLLGSNCELLREGEEVPRGSRPGGELAADWRGEGRESHHRPARTSGPLAEVGYSVPPRLGLLRAPRVPVRDFHPAETARGKCCPRGCTERPGGAHPRAWSPTPEQPGLLRPLSVCGHLPPVPASRGLETPPHCPSPFTPQPVPPAGTHPQTPSMSAPQSAGEGALGSQPSHLVRVSRLQVLTPSRVGGQGAAPLCPFHSAVQKLEGSRGLEGVLALVALEPGLPAPAPEV